MISPDDVDGSLNEWLQVLNKWSKCARRKKDGRCLASVLKARVRVRAYVKRAHVLVVLLVLAGTTLWPNLITAMLHCVLLLLPGDA